MRCRNYATSLRSPLACSLRTYLLLIYFQLFIVLQIITAFSGLFVITVFNFHNFYRAINQRNSLQFYILIMTYDLLSFLFSVWALLSITACYFNTDSVRYDVHHSTLKLFIFETWLLFTKLKAKRMGILVHKIIARTHDKKFILKVIVSLNSVSVVRSILFDKKNFS